MKAFDALLALPTWGLVAIGALIVAQIVLDVYAFVDLYRRPVDQLTLSNKWVWVAIILFVSTIGAIVYLIVGRKPAPVAEVAPRDSAAARGANAADALYGPPKGVDPR
jgi:hypothetical protein